MPKKKNENLFNKYILFILLCNLNVSDAIPCRIRIQMLSCSDNILPISVWPLELLHGRLLLRNIEKMFQFRHDFELSLSLICLPFYLLIQFTWTLYYHHNGSSTHHLKNLDGDSICLPPGSVPRGKKLQKEQTQEAALCEKAKVW